jgi:membrane associated rhomboid family serine protease
MIVTYLLLGFTCLVSFLYMQNQEFKNKFMFNAYAIKHRNEWWRWFTGGILHADFIHLLFNMMTLYFFGEIVEALFNGQTIINDQIGHPLFGPGKGSLMFFLMYISAIPISSAYSFFKNRHNPYYNALGASGAVSAVVYTFILLAPTYKIYIFGAVGIPGWIYGILYLVISWNLARRNVGNIGHDAHFYGALYGFIFPLVFFPFLAEKFVSTIVGSFVN